jgi:hypothetical protein
MSEALAVVATGEHREAPDTQQAFKSAVLTLVDRSMHFVTKDMAGQIKIDTAGALAVGAVIALIAVTYITFRPNFGNASPTVTATPAIVRSLDVQQTVAATAPATTRVRPPTPTPTPTRNPEQEFEYLDAYVHTLVQPGTNIEIKIKTPSISIQIPGPLGINVYGGPYAGISVGAIAPRGGVTQSPLGWSVKVGENKWIVWDKTTLTRSGLSVNLSRPPEYIWASVP